MNNQGAIGISTILILISLLLVGATATSVMMSTSDDLSEEDITLMVDTITTKYSTYLQIEDILGQYTGTGQERYIEKIAVLIQPLFTTTIDLSQMIIKINTGNTVKILYYNQESQHINYHSLFYHPLWETINQTTYSAITIHDNDNSISDYATLDDNTDLTYILIKIPEDLQITKGDQISITFILPTGISRTLTVYIPFSVKPIVSLQ